jgi:ABC-type dipeptide/oligopeptide/nickel transport system ATPase component/ABC-type dipeptide/oligopeptide/nickel transport system permease subunit
MSSWTARGEAVPGTAAHRTGLRGAALGRALPGGRFALAGACLLGLFALVALAAPLLAPYEPTARVATPFAAPSAAHPLGANDLGQDLLSELLYGARVSLAVGLGASAIAMLMGVTVGLVAGYARGWVDAALMRAVDVALSLPFLPLAIVLGAFLGPGLATLVIVIAAVMWAGPARELRAQVLSARERDHVLAARAMGAGPARVLARHVLPEVAPLVVPQFVLAAKLAILLEASLSFLGLGDAGAKSWGTMLFFAHSRSAFLTDAWLWWVLPAGLCIAATVLGFAFLGYGFEERARPSLRRWMAPSRRRGGRAQGSVGDVAVSSEASPEPEPAEPTAAPGGSRGVWTEGLVAARKAVVEYDTADGPVRAVDGASLAIAPGEAVGLVGASGSGKTSLVSAMAGLLEPPARVASGRVSVLSAELSGLSPSQLRRLHGDRIACVPQQAMDALNPVLRVEDQLAEAVRLHSPATPREAKGQASTMLERVGLDPARGGDFPHQLSGGMRQRAVIAMALVNGPELVVADEPTSGLDVVAQAELVELLAALRARLGLALAVVTHDLAVALTVVDRVAIMQGGRIVEEGTPDRVVAAPGHPFTRELLAATPRLSQAAVASS